MDPLRVAIRRIEHSDHGTFGVLITPNGVLCHTLELPWRSNKRSRSCIPCGEYNVDPYTSLRRGLVYLVKDVPDRDSILFHTGNFAGDVEKGFRSDSEGCILLGMYRGEMANQKAVMSSAVAMNVFSSFLRGRSFRLVVEDET